MIDFKATSASDQPDPYDYKEFVIKKKNGKQRKIVSPSSELKALQRDKVFQLYPQFKALAGNLANRFHGFIPKRNSITAATQHIGFSSTTMYDLENFFDTVTDTHIRAAGLHIPISEHHIVYHRDGYTAQGFPSSPMLANIAAIPFMREIEQRLILLAGKGNFALTIYADDIQISLHQDSKSIWQTVHKIVNESAKKANLVINPSKTRTRFAKYGFIRMLGVNITPNGIVATRKTNRKVRAVRQQVDKKQPKGQVLGGLRTWQKCLYPKGIDIVL